MKLKIPARAFGAYLFDCDGTIADSMPWHYVAWKSALAEWNCDFPAEELFSNPWGGFPVAEQISRLNEKQGLQMPIPEVAQRKEEFYFDALPHLKAVPEVLEHVDAQHGRIPFAVVSGKRSRFGDGFASHALAIAEKVEELRVCAGDYKRGKPDPEAFLIAAARLRVKPQACLVFEDTDMGIEAAKSAGMKPR